MEWKLFMEEVTLVILTSSAFSIGIQELWKHHLGKKFKKYEFDLTEKSKNIDRDLSLLIEGHKKALEFIQFKDSRLHEKRLQVISDIYKKLVKLDLAMKEMTSLIKIVTNDSIENFKIENSKIELASNKHNDFYIYYLKHKIFLSPTTCELIDKIKNDYFDSYQDYTHGKKYENESSDFSFQYAKAASEKVRKDIPLILENIENEFRSIIGVNN